MRLKTWPWPCFCQLFHPLFSAPSENNTDFCRYLYICYNEFDMMHLSCVILHICKVTYFENGGIVCTSVCVLMCMSAHRDIWRTSGRIAMILCYLGSYCWHDSQVWFWASWWPTLVLQYDFRFFCLMPCAWFAIVFLFIHIDAISATILCVFNVDI